MECVLNRCGRKQGIGTWVSVEGKQLPVCEKHWKALQPISPLPKG